MPEIRNLPLAELKPWHRNARFHSRRQVKQLARSIRRFGFTHPILIDEDNRILAGHGRARAARELGLTEVPCLTIKHLSPAEKRAYVLADNKLALDARWDHKLLAEELTGLLAEDITLDTGFSLVDIEGLVAGNSVERNENRAGGNTPVAARRCQAGDIWRLGPNWLVCGEALKPDTVSALIEGQMVRMLIASPAGASSTTTGTEDGNWAGATLLSAEKAGRRVVMSERDIECCDRIIRRWEAHTKIAASRFNPESQIDAMMAPA